VHRGLLIMDLVWMLDEFLGWFEPISVLSTLIKVAMMLLSIMLSRDLGFVRSLLLLFSFFLLLSQMLLPRFVHLSFELLYAFSVLLHALLTFLVLLSCFSFLPHALLTFLVLLSFFSLLNHSLLLCVVHHLSVLFSMCGLVHQSLLVFQLLQFHSFSSHLKIDVILILQRTIALMFIPAVLRYRSHLASKVRARVWLLTRISMLKWIWMIILSVMVRDLGHFTHLFEHLMARERKASM